MQTLLEKFVHKLMRDIANMPNYNSLNFAEKKAHELWVQEQIKDFMRDLTK
jgi:hypothetical protein